MLMELLSDPAVKAGIAILILIIVSASAFFLVARLRDYTSGDWDATDDQLLNFEEMRLKGDISEEEFRTIQAASRNFDDEGSIDLDSDPDVDSDPDD